MMYKLELCTLFALVLGTNADWDCDSRCPGYNACLQENANGRRMAELEPAGPDPSMIEDDIWNATWPTHRSTEDSTTTFRSSTTSTSNLRGSHATLHRKLDELDVIQLQMYWQEGTCWQAEWRPREWCLRCEGSTCQEGDYLVLDECSSSSRQRFIYQKYPGTGGGKIMPFTNQDLCWTRTRVNAHQLKPCGNQMYVDRQGLDIQIIVGLDLDAPSELHPNGIYDKCMNNHHHPKSQEIVRAGHCDEARRNKTSKWIAINRSTISVDNSDTPSPTPSPPVQLSDGTGGTSSVSPVKALGSEYCDEHLCGVCEGDCDSDDQCAGNLKCFQREGGEDVPGCSGGRDSPSKTDYCYDPSFGNDVAELNSGEPEVDDSGGSDYCNSDNKCGICQGDCDSDSDCEGDLICYQRDRYESVPGCRGGSQDSSKSDYCVNP